MKKLLLSVAVIAGAATLNAQTPVGTVVNNFTLTDINGTTHNLFDYTDAGKMVVIDVSATWCSPCWSYHNTGALNDFYLAHGPAGADDAMVFFVEGDPSTNSADLNGTGTNTQGDWVTGESMPIIDLTTQASFENSGMDIAYFPVMYVICPNRTILASGVAGSIGTLASLNGMIGDCPAPASQSNDPAILSYQGVTKDCAALDLVVKLQNNGTAPLTACTITATKGAATIATYNWSGNLATYGSADVTIGTYLPTSSADNINIAITSADNNAANNAVATVVGLATVGASNNVTVKVTIDRYGSETGWKIKRSNGTTAYTGPAYTDQASNGSYAQADINISLPDDCYSLEVTDSYGDGFDPSYGNGFIQVWVNGAQIGGVNDFTGDFAADKFQLEAVAGINEMTGTEFNVFPNPASDKLNVTFEAANSDYQVAIMDLQGRTVASQNLQSLNGAQTVEFAVSDLAKGSYIVTVSTNGLTRTQNVVIK